MPEWYIINLSLLLLSIGGLFWKPLLMALPLLIVAAGLPFINVVKSMSEPSFSGQYLTGFARLNLRLLTGFLHIIQPMARLIGRLSCGLTPWRRQLSPHYAFPWPRKYEIWSENWQAPDKWLQSVNAAFAKLGAIAKRGGAFDRWDLEVRGGLCGAARLQMAIEEHGAGKQLVRFRTRVIVYPAGLILLIMLGFLTLWAAVDQSWLVVVLLCTAAAGLSLNIFQDCAAAVAVCRQALRAQAAPDKGNAALEKDVAGRNMARDRIIFLDLDHRPKNDPAYNGPERRNGLDRRSNIVSGKFERKPPNRSRYSGPERRSGLERRFSSAEAASR